MALRNENAQRGTTDDRHRRDGGGRAMPVQAAETADDETEVLGVNSPAS